MALLWRIIYSPTPTYESSYVMTLAEFLLARIGEDENAARACRGEHWQWEDDHTDEVVPPVPANGETFMLSPGGNWSMSLRSRETYPYSAIPGEGPTIYFSSASEVNAHGAAHIARWDPARVLAECEAKRRIVQSNMSRRLRLGALIRMTSRLLVRSWRCMALSSFSPCPTPTTPTIKRAGNRDHPAGAAVGSVRRYRRVPSVDEGPLRWGLVLLRPAVGPGRGDCCRGRPGSDIDRAHPAWEASMTLRVRPRFGWFVWAASGRRSVAGDVARALFWLALIVVFIVVVVSK